MKKKGILIITPFFSPNIGGAETHLDDLVDALDELEYSVFVQTYSPITTKKVSWESSEKKGKNIEIKRYRWFGKNLFHKLEKLPFLNFLYLTPYLFFRVFSWFLFNKEKVETIHAHGFNAALIGVALKRIFKKRLVVSTHAIYEIEADSGLAKKISSILNKSDKVLSLSRRSLSELLSFGVKKEKLDLYRHWIDLEKFKFLDKKEEIRKKLGMKDSFSVLYLGRIMEKKGVKILVEIAKRLKKVEFIFIGNGPEDEFLRREQKKISNIKYFGQVNSDRTFEYYNASDVFCLPSQYEEGFGRVLMEAVACNLPVVASSKGGIPEALDNSVSILVEPKRENVEKAILKLFEDRKKYLEMAGKCREYAMRNFSKKNVASIIKYY